MRVRIRVPEGMMELSGEDIFKKVKSILEICPSEYTCYLRVWYEGFEGYGVPGTDLKEVLNEAIRSCGWIDAGAVRFEKFGFVDPAFRNPDYPNAAKDMDGAPMILHRFRQGAHYKGPDGKIFWIPVIETFDLRGFEWKDGKYIGSMVEIDPFSDYARQLEEVKLSGTEK